MTKSTAQYTQRVQTLFTPHQYDLLCDYAEETERPLSVVVRETVAEHLLAQLEKRQRQQALERLCSGDTPVDDWPEMERQIETMWEEETT